MTNAELMARLALTGAEVKLRDGFVWWENAPTDAAQVQATLLAAGLVAHASAWPGSSSRAEVLHDFDIDARRWSVDVNGRQSGGRICRIWGVVGEDWQSRYYSSKLDRHCIRGLIEDWRHR